MRILVLSDSHSALRLMRRAINTLKPNAVVHLGDCYDDATAMAEEYPHIPFHQVAGNCDRYRCGPEAREMLCYDVCGVRLYMTHGHNHHVKQTLFRLLADARKAGAAAVLFGHTHQPYCEEEDGLLVCNPGSCGHGGGTVALIETDQGMILHCWILREDELEEMV